MTIKVENLQDGYDHHQLTIEELHMLLSWAELTATPDSPLRELMPMEKTRAGADLVNDLRQKGLLTRDEEPTLVGVVRQALETAASPLWTISLRAGDCQGLTGATFLSRDNRLDHSLVRFRQHENQDVSLSYFLSKEHILSLLEPYVRFNALSGGPDLQFSLTINEYMVLLAVADAFRQAHLEALLERQLIEDWKVAIEEIESALDKGAAFIDPRWLVSVAHLSIPISYQWQREAVRIGIEGLVAKELLQPKGNGQLPRYGMSHKLEIFCTALMGITGFGALQITRLTADQKWGIVCLSLLRTSETIWLTGYNDLAGPLPRVTLFSAEGFFVAQALTELMERSVQTSAPTLDQIQPHAVICDACGAAVAPQSKFCSSCGQALISVSAPEPQKFCNQCGTRLRPGIKFCTSCGAAIQ